MNLLGKLFIVLIFIGSIILASFSVVLYSTHKNWREMAVKLQDQLKVKTDELATSQKSRSDLEMALNLEIRSQVARNATLSERAAFLEQDNDVKNSELAGLREDLAQQVAAVERAGDMARALRSQLEGTSKELLDAQRDWAERTTELTKKTEEAHSLAALLSSYQTTSAQLAQDYRDVVEVLRIHGLSADPELYSRQPPSGITGVVTEVRPIGTVEISIGSDSGLARGHQLDVIRNREGRSTYVGKIEIVQTAADRAVAKVLPEFRRGVIRQGDEVTYIDLNTVVVH